MSLFGPDDMLRYCRNHTRADGEIDMFTAIRAFSRDTGMPVNELSNMRQLLLNTGKLVRHESRWYWPQS